LITSQKATKEKIPGTEKCEIKILTEIVKVKKTLD
jgi:hypothetical protein